MKKFYLLLISLTLALSTGCSSEPSTPQSSQTSTAPASNVKPEPEEAKVTIGKIQEVAEDGTHFIVTTADGAKEKIEVEGDTHFHDIAEGTKAIGHEAAKVGKTIIDETGEGFHTVVHYSEKTGKKTAKVVKHGLESTVKQVDGTIDEIDPVAKTVAVKTKDGAKEVYHLAEDTTVKVGDKAVDFGKWIADKSKDTGQAVVHFTEKSGKKIAHAVEN